MSLNNGQQTTSVISAAVVSHFQSFVCCCEFVGALQAVDKESMLVRRVTGVYMLQNC